MWGHWRRNVDRSELGFTLVELIVVMFLIAILTTFSAAAFRHYWLVRSIRSSQDQVVVEIRQAQQRAEAESYPNVYGLRFANATSNWYVVKGNAATNTCSVIRSYTFEDKAITQAPPTGYDFVAMPTSTPVGALTAACQAAAPAAAGSQVALFYPSGASNAASGGSRILLYLGATGQTRTITVSPLTGKVTRS